MNKPAWVLSGSPWVTLAFAVVQIREIMSVMKNKQPPAESESLQVKPVLYLNYGMWPVMKNTLICSLKGSKFNVFMLMLKLSVYLLPMLV